MTALWRRELARPGIGRDRGGTRNARGQNEKKAADQFRNGCSHGRSPPDTISDHAARSRKSHARPPLSSVRLAPPDAAVGRARDGATLAARAHARRPRLSELLRDRDVEPRLPVGVPPP